MIEDEVRSQLDEILELDDKDEPNFGDTDCQLAAFVTALCVMTQLSAITVHGVPNCEFLAILTHWFSQFGT